MTAAVADASPPNHCLTCIRGFNISNTSCIRGQRCSRFQGDTSSYQPIEQSLFLSVCVKSLVAQLHAALPQRPGLPTTTSCCYPNSHDMLSITQEEFLTCGATSRRANVDYNFDSIRKQQTSDFQWQRVAELGCDAAGAGLPIQKKGPSRATVLPM